MQFYIVDLILLGIILTSGTVLFGLYGTVWVTAASLAAILLTKLTFHVTDNNHRTKEQWIAAATASVVIVTISFLIAISNVYREDALAGSPLRDDNITKVRLRIVPADATPAPTRRPRPRPRPRSESIVQTVSEWFRTWLTFGD